MNGEPVRRQALSPGDQVVLGDFRLRIEPVEFPDPYANMSDQHARRAAIGGETAPRKKDGEGS